MAVRITSYKQAFEDVLSVKYNSCIQNIIKNLESEGHTEKSICYAIWRTQDKLLAYNRDNRFPNILINEIRKWSWGRNDPRWVEYNKRKDAERKAQELAQKIKRTNAKLEQEHREGKYPGTKLGLENGKVILTQYFVYFIQGECGGPIKIGYTLDPSGRLKQLQTGHHDTLNILGLIRGDEKTEAEIHKRFDHIRIRGEWFKPEQELLDYIAATAQA